MQGLPAEVGTARTATPAIATNGNPLETGHSLDVEMQQISGTGVLIALHRGSGVEIAPATEMGAAEDAADGGRTQSGGVGDVIGGTLLAPQVDAALAQARGSGARAEGGAGGRRVGAGGGRCGGRGRSAPRVGAPRSLAHGAVARGLRRGREL